MEEKTATAVLEYFPKVADHFERLYPGVSPDFYRKLQGVHDGWNEKAGLSNLEDRLKKFANVYDLKIPK